jgi:hypothetical protein
MVTCDECLRCFFHIYKVECKETYSKIARDRLDIYVD